MTTNQRDHVPNHRASQLFAGGGETGALMQAMDWAETPLGAVESWPQSLKTAVGICLASRFPMLLWWGPELIMLYNDAYRPMLGTTKHPQALGHRGQDCWSEIWNIIGPMLEGVMRTGIATWSDDQFLPLERYGYSEECYFTYSYSPIRDETGGVGGVFTAVTETTSRVLSERRSRTARELAAALVNTHTSEEVLLQAARVFEDNPHDLPFTLLYRLESPAPLAHLVATTGLAAGTPLSPHHLSLTDPEACWQIQQVTETLQAGLVTDLALRCDSISVQARPNPTPHSGLVLPLVEPGQTRPTALMVAGISPRLALDDAYRAFNDLLAGHVATALASAHAYEAERRRAEALAELDRAKTIFFSNVSHEFRTPLTLMLGPLEDLLGADDLLPDQHDQLDMIHRNGLRLLKLVNTLLDFSRIEAGRAQAVYVPTDLAALTSDLASVFHSLIEQAGLQLVVECPPLSEPVYVDREMWEKIVLNLLSNAFKFTFAGEITVALRQVEQRVELVVRDTGTGIARDEVPRLFERFHRVQGARSRTNEGSGIGLALVQELVHMHGGTIEVESQLDVGTIFTVRLPLGTAHLPADRIRGNRTHASTALGAAPFVEEARRWLPEATSSQDREMEWQLHDAGRSPVSVAGGEEAPPPARILVADDNADLRAYLSRLLAPHYNVEAVVDGAAALQAARRCPPDLVLADVMMPELDGFELLHALHADPDLEALPVILLSARAGEEATLEGLAAGANDYLVKPFSAREVQARIATHLEIARLRREADTRAHELAVILEAMDDGVLLIDPGGKIVRNNTACFRLVQIEHSADWQTVFLRATIAERNLLMRTTDPSGHPLSAEAWPANRLLRGETFTGSQAQEYRITGMAGQQRLLSVSGVPLYDAQGQVQGGIEVLHDLTARYEQEQERAQMLNVVAHELRSPLTSLKMGIELNLRRLARGTPVEPNQLQSNAQAVERMERLVNDLLNAARAETVQVGLQRAPTDLTALCKQVANEQMRTSGRKIDLDMPEEPVIAEVDRGRIGQVVENLLSNALKYSPTEATVALQLRQEGGDALIAVQDSGPGIPADVQPRLFERFYRAPGAKVLHGTGVGLGVGLYLSKQLVERHGGTISVASEVGHGTIFTVRLPLTS
jgi:signal transduction histidine kinase/CheY-like chemotaxis protein